MQTVCGSIQVCVLYKLRYSKLLLHQKLKVMKRFLLLFSLFLLINQVKSQEIPTALIDRVNSVKYIFEGEVLDSKSYLTNDVKFIRTSNLVQITKILNPCSSILKLIELVESENISITVYPNPCSQYLNVNISNSDNMELTLSIYDLTGSLVYQKNNTKTVNVTNLSKGTYILRVHNREGLFKGAAKFVKQ